MSVAAGIRERIARTKKREVEPAIEEIVTRWLNGESRQVLARECACSGRTITRRIKRWMLAGHGDQGYADLVTEALVNRIADADDKLEAASDPVQVSKYRDMARFARMDFERRRPALYGPKQEVKHSGIPPTLNITVVRESVGALIEHHPQPALPAPQGEEDDEKADPDRLACA